LLAEPDPHLLDARKRLLCNTSYRVHAVRTPCEVFEIQPEDDPHIVLLSDALGEHQLNAVAEYARHRWPHARILIIGESTPALEDHLYDETVSGASSPAEFLAAVERCLLF
jgi:hypothetical protein